MIEEGVLEKYDSVCPYDKWYNRDKVLRIVDGSAITAVKGKYNRREQYDASYLLYKEWCDGYMPQQYCVVAAIVAG